MFLSTLLCCLICSTFNVEAVHPDITEEAVGNVTLTRLIGHITSPGFNQNLYPHKADRWWIIKANEGNRIKLEFEVLKIKNPFADCTSDYVAVYTDPSTKSPERYCTKKRPEGAIFSTENEMLIHFVTDDFFSNAEGFAARYTVINKNDVPLEEKVKEESNDDYDYYEYYDMVPVTPPKSSVATQAPKTESQTIKPAKTTKPLTTTKPEMTTKLVMTTKQVRKTKSTKTPTEKLTTSRSQKSTSSQAATTSAGKGLLTRITTPEHGVGNNGGSNSGSGYGKGIIIGIGIFAILAICVLLMIAFIRYRKQKQSQFISLRDNSSLDFPTTDDTKKLVNEPSIYKKNGSHFIAVPQQESMPL